MGHPETEGDGLTGTDREGMQSCVTDEVARGVGRCRRQFGAAAAEELHARIADRRAAAVAGVAQREAELAMAGGSLLAEKRERQPGGHARVSAGGRGRQAGSARGTGGRG